MNKIKCLIVDDEAPAVALIEQYASMIDQIEIVGKENSAIKAFQLLQKLNVDLIFLDIQMPVLNGLDFIRTLQNPPLIILTTAFREYAYEGYDLDVIDYLLKPIDNNSLGEAINRVSESKRSWQKQILTEIYSKINSPNTVFSKIVLPTSSGYEFVEISDILRCEANSNYATVYLLSGSKIVISRPLKYLDELLEGHGFFRIHQSNLVNLSYLKKYDKNDGGYVTMTDGSRVNVANAKKSGFEAFLKRS